MGVLFVCLCIYVCVGSCVQLCACVGIACLHVCGVGCRCICVLLRLRGCQIVWLRAGGVFVLLWLYLVVP